MLVFEIHQLFQHKVVEEETSHLKIIDGEGSSGGKGDNVQGPLEAPDHRSKSIDAREPDAANAMLASIAVSNVVGSAWHELPAFNGLVTQDKEDGSKIFKGTVLG